MARSVAPQRGEVSSVPLVSVGGICVKGFRDAVVAVADMRATLKARLKARLASLQNSRLPQAVRKQGRRLPRRGDIKERIAKEAVDGVAMVLKKLIEPAENHSVNRAPQRCSDSDLRRDDVPTSEPVKVNEPHEPVLAIHAPELGMVNEPPGHVLVLVPAVTQARERGTVDVPGEQTPEPVLDLETQSSEAPAESSIQAFDKFLQDLPLPTKKDGQWPEVDRSRALEHQGSILYKDQEGNWVAKCCCDYSDTVLVPLTVPSVRVPMPQ